MGKLIDVGEAQAAVAQELMRQRVDEYVADMDREIDQVEREVSATGSLTSVIDGVTAGGRHFAVFFIVGSEDKVREALNVIEELVEGDADDEAVDGT